MRWSEEIASLHHLFYLRRSFAQFVWREIMSASSRATFCILTVILFAGRFASGEWKTDGTWLRTRQDDELIALAAASGDTKIGLVYLTKDPARVDWLLSEIGRWGGTAEHVDRAVGYVRAVIPAQYAHAALDMPAGVAAAIDFNISLHLNFGSYAAQEPPIDADRIRAEINSPTTRRFLHSPSPLLRDLRADEWIERHPTFDGRGVVIADVEGFTDPMIPELSGALSLDGKPIRKIATVHLADDPGDGAGLADMSRQWVNMNIHFSGTDSVTFNSISYRLPHPGDFRLGMFDLTAVMQSGVVGAAISDGQFAVLWEESSGLVWVDIKRSHDFRLVRPMRDFNVSGEWSSFGAPHPEKYPLLRPAVSFVVLEDRARESVGIVLGMDVHAAGVTTSAAGRRMGSGDPVSGVAPAAQVSSFVCSFYKLHSRVEALIAAFEDPKSDIVLSEVTGGGMTTEDYHGGFLSELGERLVDQFDKPLIEPGDNSPKLASTTDVGLGRNVVAVGGSQSAASYLRYEGFLPSTSINKSWNAETDGPGPDGQLKPDVLAPSGYVAGAQRFYWNADEQRKVGLYTLPAGYQRFGGTSQAAPTAAGAAALLLSAAKQTELHIHATDLANALRFGASLAPNLTAHEQGNGEIDVARSWQILTTRAKGTPATTPEVGQPCGGSVRTSWWSQGVPRAETGILETIGWHPDDRGVRTLSFCFLQQPQNYKASLLLNDGSFRIAGVQAGTSSINVAVEIHPIQAGLHSAIVELEDSRGTVIGRGMVSIGATAPLDKTHQYRMEQEIQVPRPGYTATLVSVPAGTDALLVHADREMPFGMEIQDPDGRFYTYISPSYQAFRDRNNTSQHSVTIPHPRAGTWSILLIDNHDVPANTRDVLTVTPSVVDVQVQAVRVERASGTEFHNVFADVPVRLAGTMQSLIATKGELTSAAPVVIPVQLSQDTDALMIDLSGSASSIDAYFLNCREKSCTPVASAVGDNADKRLTIPHVRAGSYQLILEDYDLGGIDGTQKHYRASVFPYLRTATSISPVNGSVSGSAYEVNCDAADHAVTSGPRCGLFLKSDDGGVSN
jgi:hypothetical protein